LQAIRLTPTSHIVLGLIDVRGEATTPYELKAMVAAGLGDLWSIQHAQLYSEPARLAEAGYLNEEQEDGGRRRKRYTLTAQGRAALRDWAAEPTDALTELRDLGLLKLFFGADPAALAAEQLPAHRRQLARYEALRDALLATGSRGGALLALEAGIGHEREYIRFWSRLAEPG
jgi:DNA-binding PadR family transcriptional regulator